MPDYREYSVFIKVLKRQTNGILNNKKEAKNFLKSIVFNTLVINATPAIDRILFSWYSTKPHPGYNARTCVYNLKGLLVIDNEHFIKKYFKSEFYNVLQFLFRNEFGIALIM